jgi:hypothetical protein
VKIEAAFVPIDRRYLMDRAIADLRGGQQYSHVALIVYHNDCPPMWHDVRWDWLNSAARVMPAAQYEFKYDLYEVLGMTKTRAEVIHRWLQRQESHWVQYDPCGAIRLFLRMPARNTPRMFLCFEYMARAFQAGGLLHGFKAEGCLGSDLVETGAFRLKAQDG